MASVMAIALATSVLAALAFYAASPNSLWPSIRRWRKAARLGAALSCALSTICWIAALGAGVGICATLASCMLTLVLLPWLALFTRPSRPAHIVERD